MAGMGDERRTNILQALKDAISPVTGTELSRLLGVSRQAIVNDVAVLRAGGAPIVGSPRGYLLAGSGEGQTAVIACRHDGDLARQELEVLVDHGITVLDVTVEHALYGEVKANLMVSSRRDVDRFVADLEREEVEPLSSLTAGVHVHHLRIPSEDALAAAARELAEIGVLLED